MSGWILQNGSHNCFLPVRREVAMEKGRVNNRCYDGKKNVKTRDD